MVPSACEASSLLKMTPGWSQLRRPLFVDGVLPLIAFVAVRPHVGSDAAALAAIVTIPVADVLIRKARGRTVDPVGLIAVVAVGLSLLGSLLSHGSALLLELRPAVTTGVFGLGCLASLALPHPAMFHVGRSFAAEADPTAAETLDVLASAPLVASALRRVTVGWSAGLLVQALAITALAFTQSTETYLVGSLVADWFGLAVLIIATKAYVRTTVDRLECCVIPA